MPVNASTQILQSQSLSIAARYASVRRAKEIATSDGEKISRAETKFEAGYAAMGVRVSGDGQTGTASIDSVQISLSSSLTIDDANKILKDQLSEKINAAFKEAGVDIDIEEVQKQNQDTSPEATARRIVDFATGFFGVYAKNHGNEEDTGRLDGFMSLIRDAVDKGFADARDILKGIADISGPVSDGIDRTYDLTQKGLDEFRRKQLDLISGGDQGGNSEQPAEAASATAI